MDKYLLVTSAAGKKRVCYFYKIPPKWWVTSLFPTFHWKTESLC